jgi:hypothetical protein
MLVQVITKSKARVMMPGRDREEDMNTVRIVSHHHWGILWLIKQVCDAKTDQQDKGKKTKHGIYMIQS